jgi:hypothetical protein
MTNNKQQTAVDILCGKLAMKLGIPQAITFYIDHQEEIREAKEMEKEKMIEFSEQVFRNRYNEVYQSLTKVATDTYNETYGGGEQ